MYANGGVASEATYPYVAKTGTCNKNLAKKYALARKCTHSMGTTLHVALRVAVDIKGYYKVPKDNETAMALALSKGVGLLNPVGCKK